MKLKKIILTLLFVVGIGSFLTNNQTNHVEAATAQRVSVPAKFRGTWYVADHNDHNKVNAYKFTNSKIAFLGYTPASNTQTYKYTRHAFNTLPQSKKYLLIKSQGNQLFCTMPGSQSIGMILSNNHKTMYLKLDTSVVPYYRSRSLAAKNAKRDNTRSNQIKFIKKFNREFKLKY